MIFVSLLSDKVLCTSMNLLLLSSGIWYHESGVIRASTDGFVQGDFSKSHIVHHQQKDQSPTLPAIIEVNCHSQPKILQLPRLVHLSMTFS